MKTYVCVALATLLIAAPAVAQDADEMARKLQDPLASIKALMADNGIEFNTGDDEVKSYSFQLQPVYAMSFEKFNFISRAVFPILTNVGGEPPPGCWGRPGAKLLPRAAGPGTLGVAASARPCRTRSATTRGQGCFRTGRSRFALSLSCRSDGRPAGQRPAPSSGNRS